MNMNKQQHQTAKKYILDLHSTENRFKILLTEHTYHHNITNVIVTSTSGTKCVETD